MVNRRISVIKIVHILLLNNISINIVYTINKYDKLFTAFTTIAMRRTLYTVNHTHPQKHLRLGIIRRHNFNFWGGVTNFTYDWRIYAKYHLH
jgi:hypothetical protein